MKRQQSGTHARVAMEVEYSWLFHEAGSALLLLLLLLGATRRAAHLLGVIGRHALCAAAAEQR